MLVRISEGWWSCRDGGYWKQRDAQITTVSCEWTESESSQMGRNCSRPRPSMRVPPTGAASTCCCGSYGIEAGSPYGCTFGAAMAWRWACEARDSLLRCSQPPHHAMMKHVCRPCLWSCSSYTSH